MKIGLFDSGVGGLTIADILIYKLESYFKEYDLSFEYFADISHIPYGDKSEEYILKRLEDVFKFFDESGCELVFISCHTASVIYIKYFDIKLHNYKNIKKIFSTLKPTAEKVIVQHPLAKIVFTGTNAMIKSGVFQSIIKRENTNYISIPSSIVKLIEYRHYNDAAMSFAKRLFAQNAINDEDRKCNSKKITIPTQIFFSCTHYNIIREELNNLLAEYDITFIDPLICITEYFQDETISFINTKLSQITHKLNNENKIESITENLKEIELNERERKLNELEKELNLMRSELERIGGNNRLLNYNFSKHESLNYNIYNKKNNDDKKIRISINLANAQHLIDELYDEYFVNHAKKIMSLFINRIKFNIIK